MSSSNCSSTCGLWGSFCIIPGTRRVGHHEHLQIQDWVLKGPVLSAMPRHAHKRTFLALLYITWFLGYFCFPGCSLSPGQVIQMDAQSLTLSTLTSHESPDLSHLLRRSFVDQGWGPHWSADSKHIRYLALSIWTWLYWRDFKHCNLFLSGIRNT